MFLADINIMKEATMGGQLFPAMKPEGQGV